MPRTNKSSSGGATAQDSGGSVTGQLSLQVQALQQEVSELRGLVEEQRHQLEQLKQQSLERYTDLDNRLQGGGQGQGQQAGAAVAGAAAGADAGIAADATPAPPPAVNQPAQVQPPANGGGMQTARPEEYEAYQKAFTKLKGQDVTGAIKDFNSFLATYPNSSLGGNAYYWLGMAYLRPPQDAAKAQQSFSKVVTGMPQHLKAPDALYELGKLSFAKGDKAKAKAQMQQVIDTYGTSGSTAPQLAKQFLDQNFKK